MCDPLFQSKTERQAEFRRLRDLMSISCRSDSTILSSKDLDDFQVEFDSMLHYDVREPDSLIEKVAPELQVQSSEKVLISCTLVDVHNHAGDTVFRPSTDKRFEAVFPTSQYCQTLSPEKSESLQYLLSDLVPKMETEISLRDSIVSRLEGEMCFLLSRISSCILLMQVRGKLQKEEHHTNFHLSIDLKSVDVFSDILSKQPVLTWPLEVLTVKISIKQSRVDFYFQKTPQFSIDIVDIHTYKKLISGLRLVGIPISLVDVPRDTTGLIKGESQNPRRLSRGE